MKATKAVERVTIFLFWTILWTGAIVSWVLASVTGEDESQ